MERHWIPGIREGYVPQGVALADDVVLVSAYHPDAHLPDKSTCRLFVLCIESGSPLTEIALPEDCSHAGGLAYAGNNRLFLSDTAHLYEIDLRASIHSTNRRAVVVSNYRIERPLIGSFLVWDGKNVWLGAYEKERESRLFMLDSLPKPNILAHETPSLEDKISFKDTVRMLNLPPKAQGAAFDKAGNLWVISSSSKFGSLYKINVSKGNVVEVYPLFSGLQGMQFSDSHTFWTVSESAALKYRDWNVFFPFVFSLDVEKLEK